MRWDLKTGHRDKRQRSDLFCLLSECIFDHLPQDAVSVFLSTKAPPTDNACLRNPGRVR
jgi:hypothetical protein